MPRIKSIRVWLAAGIVFGFLAFLVALFTTWVLSGPKLSRLNYSSQRSYLRSIRLLADEFREEHGRFPSTLDELHGWNPDWRWYKNEKGEICGRWMNPLTYRLKESNPLLISYGHDDLPGGVGIDIDITSDSSFPDAYYPDYLTTFWQYFRYSNMHYFYIESLFAGALGSLLFLGLIRPSQLSQPARMPFLRLFSYLVVVSILTYVVTYAILMARI